MCDCYVRAHAEAGTRSGGDREINAVDATSADRQVVRRGEGPSRLGRGEPLDPRRSRGNQVVVRRALEGERMATLDGIERTFTADDLLICDAEGPVAIVCGKGNNGGDGFVLARYLQEWGARITCWVIGERDELTSDTLRNHRRFSWRDGWPTRQSRSVGRLTMS